MKVCLSAFALVVTKQNSPKGGMTDFYSGQSPVELFHDIATARQYASINGIVADAVQVEVTIASNKPINREPS